MVQSWDLATGRSAGLPTIHVSNLTAEWLSSLTVGTVGLVASMRSLGWPMTWRRMEAKANWGGIGGCCGHQSTAKCVVSAALIIPSSARLRALCLFILSRPPHHEVASVAFPSIAHKQAPFNTTLLPYYLIQSSLHSIRFSFFFQLRPCSTHRRVTRTPHQPIRHPVSVHALFHPIPRRNFLISHSHTRTTSTPSRPLFPDSPTQTCRPSITPNNITSHHRIMPPRRTTTMAVGREELPAYLHPRTPTASSEVCEV